MYQVVNPRRILRLRGRTPGRRVARNVVLLGIVSFFTDISSEMVATILPLYLVYTLGFTPLQFGVVDGLQQGAAALVRVAGGFAADRTRRHKEVAGLGYAISAFSRLGLLAAQSVSALGAIVFLDRTGKGIRTAPRDALISLSSERESLGAAFGVHRALDTAGAMLGPLIAFMLLWLAPDEFDAIFVVSFCFALIGLAVLALFVENRPAPAPEVEHVSVRAAARLLGTRRFATLVAVGATLALATISDGFLFIGLQRHLDFEPRFLPLLFVGTAFAYMVLAIPVGRLADSIGRGRVFVVGYTPLLAAYGLLLLPAGPSVEIVLFLAASGALLRGDGWRPDGARERCAAARAAGERAGAARDRDEPRPVVGLGGLRHYLDMDECRNGDRGLRGRAPDGDGGRCGGAATCAGGCAS